MTVVEAVLFVPLVIWKHYDKNKWGRIRKYPWIELKTYRYKPVAVHGRLFYTSHAAALTTNGKYFFNIIVGLICRIEQTVNSLCKLANKENASISSKNMSSHSSIRSDEDL